jgi:NTP pyrophosphatase (non-canonical NTP hydrolase)
MEALTFAHMSEVNRSRCRRWHDPDTSDPWSGADWSNAMCGEAGEAANAVKKLRRYETHTAPQNTPPREELALMLAAELADVILYVDLLAAHYGIDLAAAIAAKFNVVSIRQGFPERLP